MVPRSDPSLIALAMEMSTPELEAVYLRRWSLLPPAGQPVGVNRNGNPYLALCSSKSFNLPKPNCTGKIKEVMLNGSPHFRCTVCRNSKSAHHGPSAYDPTIQQSGLPIFNVRDCTGRPNRKVDPRDIVYVVFMLSKEYSLSRMQELAMRKILFCFTLLVTTAAIELTFELPDNAVQCFYEDIQSGIDNILEFQVVTGGQYDVDMTLEDPTGKVLYKDIKKQYDSYNWKAEHPGTYKACFSNEFSTFSHKIVYMDWQVGEPGGKTTPSTHAMSSLESSSVAIGDKLRVVDDYQTHHRLREATGRKRAEQLNERVLLWSLGQTAVIVLLGIAQVVLLRSFFSDKRSRY